MVMCFAPTCQHYSESHTCKFFWFPKDDNTLKKWIELIRRNDKNPGRYSRICSCHFVDGDKNNGPTIFNCNSGKQSASTASTELHNNERMGESTCVVKSCRNLFPGGDAPRPLLFLIPSGYDSTGQKQDHLERRRIAWISALTKRNVLSEDQLKNGRVCSRHFITGRPSREDLEDDPDWIPNQALDLDDDDESGEKLLEFVTSGLGSGAGIGIGAGNGMGNSAKIGIENVIEMSTREKTRCYACKRTRMVDGQTIISYHLFPQDEKIRNAWLKFVNKNEVNLPNRARLCTRHFTNDQTYHTDDGVKLKKDAVPTLTVPKQKYTKRSQYAAHSIPHLEEVTITRKTSTAQLPDPISVPASSSAEAAEQSELRCDIDPLYLPFVTIKEERPDGYYESPEFVTENDLESIATDVDFQSVRVKEEFDACEEFETSYNNDLIEVKHEPLFRECVESVPVNGNDVPAESPIKRRSSSSLPETESQSAPKIKVMRLSKKDFRNGACSRQQQSSGSYVFIKHDHSYSKKVQQKRNPKVKIQVPSIVDKSQTNHDYYKCQFCPYTTEYKSFLVSHLNRAHCHEQSNPEPDENGRTWQLGSRIFCPYCKETFAKEDILMQHMLNLHLFNNKPVQKTTVSALSVSGTVYNCPHCLLRSADLDKLAEHIRNKHASTYRCSECSYICHDHETFVRHSKVHYKGYKFFRCADCLELQTEDLLTVHRCKATGRLSSWNDTLEEVMQEQLKDKMSKLQAYWNNQVDAYECPGCDYTIKKEDGLKKHLLDEHTKVMLRFYCNLCMFHSQMKHEVNMHRKYTHDTSKTIEEILNNAGPCANDPGAIPNKKPVKKEFKCRFCGYTTKLRFYLNQHMKQHHLLSKPPPVVIKTEKIFIKKSSLPTKTPLSQSAAPEPLDQSRFEDYVKVISVKNPDFEEGDPEFKKTLIMYKCSLCAYCNACKKSTENHLKLRHTYNEFTYSCPFCDLKTKYKSYLQLHLNSKHMQELMKRSGVKVKVVSVLQKRPRAGVSSGSRSGGRVRMKRKADARAKSVGGGRRKRVSKPPDRLDL